MGAANMLIQVILDRAGAQDRERPIDVLPNGHPWGEDTTSQKGFIRCIVSDPAQSDSEIFDLLVPFVQSPNPDVSEEERVLAEAGHTRNWRFMTSRLPPRLSSGDREKAKDSVSISDPVYMLVENDAPTTEKMEKVRNDEVKDKRATPKSEIFGLTLTEFLACMVDKRTGEDGLGNPVSNARALRAGP